jgi:hypothetical protein
MCILYYGHRCQNCFFILFLQTYFYPVGLFLPKKRKGQKRELNNTSYPERTYKHCPEQCFGSGSAVDPIWIPIRSAVDSHSIVFISTCIASGRDFLPSAKNMSCRSLRIPPLLPSSWRLRLPRSLATEVGLLPRMRTEKLRSFVLVSTARIRAKQIKIKQVKSKSSNGQVTVHLFNALRLGLRFYLISRTLSFINTFPVACY